MTDYPFRRVGQNQYSATWGLYQGPLELSQFTFDAGAASLASIQDGPNMGLNYWSAWPTIGDSSISYTHPALSGGVGFVGATRWYSQQTGPEPAQCSQSGGVVRFLAETERHEGATQSSDSHFGVTQGFVQRESLAVQMERFFDRDSGRLRRATADAIGRILGKHARLQLAYDDSDRVKIVGRQRPNSNNLGIIACHIVVDTAYVNSQP